jgi:membrane protein DedA with SNARE-associated domain
VAWAALAAVLPLLVTGRSLTLDLLGAFIWAAALVAAHQAIAGVLQGTDARGLGASAVLGVVAAVAVARAGLRRPAPAAAEVPRMAVP